MNKTVCPNCAGYHKVSYCHSEVFKCTDCSQALKLYPHLKLDNVAWDQDKCFIYPQKP